VISALLEAGADINARDRNGWSALMWAAQGNQNPEVISALLEAGADINASSISGWTALMWAAKFNQNSNVIIALLSAGADVKAKNEAGEKALDFAQHLKGTAAYEELERRNSVCPPPSRVGRGNTCPVPSE